MAEREEAAPVHPPESREVAPRAEVAADVETAVAATEEETTATT